MNKPAYVVMAEKDMKYEAEWTFERLQDYAERNAIEEDFIIETFLKAFHKRVKGGQE